MSSGSGSAVCDAQAYSVVLTDGRSKPWRRWVGPHGPYKPMGELTGYILCLARAVLMATVGSL